MLKIGSLVDGKYKILSKVGQGGMSIVYMAINEKANKTWAVKEVCKDGVLDFEAVRQGLAAETDILKKLKHPNLPSIIDVIEEEDTYLIIMDYIEGISLSRVIEEYGPQPQECVMEWAKQLCDVLGYLHSRQPPIIYRDMKPANIMLKPDGTVVLIDFGTAREFKENNIADTRYFGTIGYAAPEQFGGRGQTDERTDIYCLGATLYHLLTGRNPGEAPYEIRPVREINPGLSSGIETILLKCTRKNPKERYTCAAQLRYALNHYEDYEEGVKKRKRRKLAAFFICAGLSLACAGMGIAFRAAAVQKASHTYQALLQNAEEASDYSKKIALYKECIAIPGQGGQETAYLELIRVFKENDQSFTNGEADILERLISNHREDLQKKPQVYTEVCYETGKLYWYYYEGNENKLTNAIYAKIWFQRVLEFAGEDFAHRNTAEVYDAIGEFYASVAALQKTGEDQGIYERFFKQLHSLMERVGKDEKETEIVRLETLELARAAIQQYSVKFRRDGVVQADLVKMLDEIGQLTEKMDTDLKLKETIIQLLENTGEDVKIAYDN